MNTGDNKHLQEEVRLRLKLSSRMSSRCVKESDSNVCKIFFGSFLGEFKSRALRARRVSPAENFQNLGNRVTEIIIYNLT